MASLVLPVFFFTFFSGSIFKVSYESIRAGHPENESVFFLSFFDNSSSLNLVLKTKLNWTKIFLNQNTFDFLFDFPQLNVCVRLRKENTPVPGNLTEIPLVHE